MKNILLSNTLFLLIGTTLSLQAIPMDDRGEDVPKNTDLRAQAARREIELPVTENELERQAGMIAEVEDPTINTGSSSSSSSLGPGDAVAGEVQLAQLGQLLMEMHQPTAAEVVALCLLDRSYDDDARNARDNADAEDASLQRRQSVINLYIQASEIYEAANLAITRLSIKASIRASYLGYAGDALCEAAKEAQQNSPREQVVNFYTQSANLLVQAVRAREEGQKEKAYHLNNVGTIFYYAAKEAERSPHQQQQQIINLCLEAVDLHMQGAEEVGKQYFQKALQLGREANEKFEKAKNFN